VSNFRGSFYLAVVSIGFVATLALLLARFLRVWQRQFCRCDPTLWSLAVHSSLALAYFAASGLVLSLDIGAYTAAAVSSAPGGGRSKSAQNRSAFGRFLVGTLVPYVASMVVAHWLL